MAPRSMLLQQEGICSVFLAYISRAVSLMSTLRLMC
jgi:hypothetical protein